MKAVTCDLCDKAFDAETFEDWLEQMKPHYMAEHADFMKASKDKSKEEGMKWMEEARKRFNEA